MIKDVLMIKSNSPEYMERAQRIVDIYNENSNCPFDEELDLIEPENTMIVYVEGDSGGVLLDFMSKHNVYRVMFAGFELENRRKGYLQNCLIRSRANNVDIALVEINGGDEAPLWRSLGFDRMGSVGFSSVLTNKELDFVHYSNSVSYPTIH